MIINHRCIWDHYGAFLAERKAGGMDNLKALLRAPKAKPHLGTDFREMPGTQYATQLDVQPMERDLTLHFCILAGSTQEWMDRYQRFIDMLRTGQDGWLDIQFPTLGIGIRAFYLEAMEPEPVTCLWRQGQQAVRFKVKFREPIPVI